MAHFPRWGVCWSSYNLHSYLIWFEHYATEDEQQSVLELHMVEHAAKTPALDAMGIIPRTIPVTLSSRGTSTELSSRPCKQSLCERCREGRGGYQFRWIDSRWTPRAALDLSLRPHEVLVAMDRPWPDGSLRIPSSATIITPTDAEIPSRVPQAPARPMLASVQQPVAYRVRAMYELGQV